MFGIPRKSWLSLALASLVSLAAGRAAAQDSPLYVPSEPASIFRGGVQFLVTSRDVDINNPSPLIAGPDAAVVNFNDTSLDYQSGLRAFLAVSSNGVRIEGVYSNYGTWNYGSAGSLTSGLAFDEGITGAWTEANLIDLTTGFEGLHAASSAAMGGDADEFEGLGPATGFAGDVLPSFNVFYKSTLQTFELNAVTEDPQAHFQFGVGYRNLQLNEAAGVQISGTLRAVDNVGLNGGISHGSLTTFGGLNFLGGTANGFEDETGNASGFADTLQMFHGAQTSNSLNGVQLIFQEQMMYWRGWTIDGIVKTGMYHNRVQGSVTEQYTGTDPGPGGDSSTYGRTFSDVKETLAFAGSVGVQSNFPLSSNWSLLAGYDMILIHGVALAPEQYDAVKGTTFTGRVYDVDTHGQIIAHGANVGLQFSY
jgi:hypothetical protein